MINYQIPIMNNSKSPHILNTSANLLGFTFLVLSSIKALGLPSAGFIDEVMSICVVIFSFSCLFSFASMRATSLLKDERYERIADYLFFSGLLILSGVALLFLFDVVDFA